MVGCCEWREWVVVWWCLTLLSYFPFQLTHTLQRSLFTRCMCLISTPKKEVRSAMHDRRYAFLLQPLTNYKVSLFQHID